MFSNVGWGEILVIFILGLILVGPERLPKVIQDVRAMLLAARTAVNEARDNLSNEFGEDFDDLRKPLQELNELRRLNPKTAITRTLFDGDDTYLDLLTGQPAAGGGAGVAAGAIGSAGATVPSSVAGRGTGFSPGPNQPDQAQAAQSYQSQRVQPAAEAGVQPEQPQSVTPQAIAQQPTAQTQPAPQTQPAAGVWHNPVEAAAQQTIQNQQTQPAQPSQPSRPEQRTQRPRDVSAWVDSDNL